MSSMTSTHRPHTADHHMTRVDIPTGMAFGSFCKAFEQAVPAFDFAHIRQITENGGTWEDIAAAVAANSPANDMMRYATLDMTALYATTDHRTKAVEYFVGNHVIADQMVRRDPKILLYAPLRILVHGDADGDAVVSIDRPSTVFASLGVREIDEVGSLLDDKIAAVLRGIGVDTGDALGPDTDQRPTEAEPRTTAPTPAVAHRPRLGRRGRRWNTKLTDGKKLRSAHPVFALHNRTVVAGAEVVHVVEAGWDALDFEVFSRQDWARLGEATPPTSACTRLTGTTPTASTGTPKTWRPCSPGPPICGSKLTRWGG